MIKKHRHLYSLSKPVVYSDGSVVFCEGVLQTHFSDSDIFTNSLWTIEGFQQKFTQKGRTADFTKKFGKFIKI